ncbi:DNA-dependent RNA polymerase [Corchorus olitorius]|uniref:DNA-dependent RNA polymerase n=1 Tax=Corchorus olitorius TaxID=93759 RepID=A0A1R3HSP3_9ROSI|nr:DNA-dependent RNA polymerase [Corchorus olitorius]
MSSPLIPMIGGLGLSYPPLNCYAICSSVVAARLELCFGLDKDSYTPLSPD